MDIAELQERQKWSLEQKIDHSLGVIETFHSRLDGKVYVSFSGGKDSTIVYWLARKIDPNIKAVFCNTGNEYPDIVKFVRGMKNDGLNVEIIYPKLKPKQVFSKYGFPVVSKEVSEEIYRAKYSPNSVTGMRAMGLIDDGKKYKSTIPKKWRGLVCTPYKISHLCCQKLKKEPGHAYEKRTGNHPIFGTMASESNQRQTAYIHRGGCNSFGENGGRISSLPLSIWLEKDVWDCIEKYKIPISEIYHKGAQRTGCMFCGYGCQFKDDNRLRLLYDLYPKAYKMFMNYENNGHTYREALRKVLATNGLSLPDEMLF